MERKGRNGGNSHSFFSRRKQKILSVLEGKGEREREREREREIKDQIECLFIAILNEDIKTLFIIQTLF